jgi:adenine-specific DNA-methyltransferase
MTFLRVQMNPDPLTEACHGTVSLPFESGAHRRVPVKSVDDRGIECLEIIPAP